MKANRNRASALSRLQVLLCLLLFIGAGIAAVGAIGSSRTIGQGGSAPNAFGDGGKRNAEGANISPEGFRGFSGQRVESPSHRYGGPGDNTFHLKIAPWVIEHTANGRQAEFF